jgi:hypothetical protein
MYRPTDRRTRVAVKASLLETALTALRKAIPLEDNDIWRARLTEEAADLAADLRRTESEYADIRQADAQVAAAALEG